MNMPAAIETLTAPPETDSAMGPKEKFIRATVAFLCSAKVSYYMRGDRVYIDTRSLAGTKLLLLEGTEFISFMLQLAKKMENLMLRSADVDLIVDHVRFHAAEVACPLAADSRGAYREDKLLINTAWADGRIIAIKDDGTWTEEQPTMRIFEPLSPKMKMAVPVARDAALFPELLRRGIGDFGENHCLLCVTCATMLLPADFVHPFIVFTGQQARGKSTTMKLLLRLIDPFDGAELMTVGEDMRDLLALVRGRHSIALDNVSSLPFDEDLLSKMYSGGLFATRKMTTNSELSEVEIPMLRVMINGIGSAFSRSDLLSRCIFIDHPDLTTKDTDGTEQFQSLSKIEQQWNAILPEALGALLRAVGAGRRLLAQRGGYKDKTSSSRFVEYCLLGECISEEMGFAAGEFTKQVKKAGEEQRAGAIEADDCAQLVLAYLKGERGVEAQLGAFDSVEAPRQDSFVVISPTDLFSEVRSIALKRNYAVYSLKWLASVKSFSAAVVRSQKNIDNGGWSFIKITGGKDNRNFKFHVK